MTTGMHTYRRHLTDLLAMLEQYEKIRDGWYDVMDDLEQAPKPELDKHSQTIVHGWLWEFMKFEVKPAGEGENPADIATLTLAGAIDDIRQALKVAR